MTDNETKLKEIVSDLIEIVQDMSIDDSELITEIERLGLNAYRMVQAGRLEIK